MTLLRLVTGDGTDPGPMSPPVVALFCGSRTFNDRTIIETLVHGVQSVATLRGRPLIIVEGEARGADTLARVEAENLGIRVVRVPADWETHGKKAGILRNIQMLEEWEPDIVIAFADDIENSKGTKHMCSIAKQRDIPVYVVARFQGGTSMTDDFNHLRSLLDGSPTWTEVGILLDRLSAARAEIKHLEALLREANDAFDEVTDDYAKELVAGEEWRTFVADEAGLSGSSEEADRA